MTGNGTQARTVQATLDTLTAVNRLAHVLAQYMQKDAVLLRGDLGAGKTTLARAILRALGCHGDIPSPTFTLVQTYELPSIHVAHFDLYRLKHPEEIDELGFDEALANGLALIEWPEKAEAYMPRKRLDILLTQDATGKHQAALRFDGIWDEPRLTEIIESLEREFVSFVDVASKNVRAFLAQAGWAEAKVQELRADFSSRRFSRLRKNDGNAAILMQSGKNQNGGAFVALAGILKTFGIHAPTLYAAEVAQDSTGQELGALVLMEDLGDRTLGQKIESDKPEGDVLLASYLQALSLLVRLHQAFTHKIAQESGFGRNGTDKGLVLPRYDSALFIAQLAPFDDSFCSDLPSAARESFHAVWRDLLQSSARMPTSLLLRDYMLDNLIELRDQNDDYGVVDFQDAGWGPITYDIASLLECVRRDWPDSLPWDVAFERIADAYLTAFPTLDRSVFTHSVIVLSAQRHMRILGRLEGLGKQVYVPRVKRFLKDLLTRDSLAPLRQWMTLHLPLLLESKP